MVRWTSAMAISGAALLVASTFFPWAGSTLAGGAWTYSIWGFSPTGRDLWPDHSWWSTATFVAEGRLGGALGLRLALPLLVLAAWSATWGAVAAARDAATTARAWSGAAALSAVFCLLAFHGGMEHFTASMPELLRLDWSARTGFYLAASGTVLLGAAAVGSIQDATRVAEGIVT